MFQSLHAKGKDPDYPPNKLIDYGGSVETPKTIPNHL